MKMQKKFLLIIPFLFSCAKKPTNKSLALDYVKEASVEAQAGNYQKALYLADQAYAINPAAHILALKATLLYQLKHFQESLKLFKKIIDDKNTPKQIRADVMNNYACNLLCLNKVEEAKKIWQELTLNKDYLSPEVAWFNLGLIEFSDALQAKTAEEETKKLQANIRFARAMQNFQQAISIAQHYIDAYYYLALCQEQLQQFASARESLLFILSTVPQHTAASALLERIDKKIQAQNN